MEWRREFSLMLGLERLLCEDEPKLVDGTTLSAHQVDALSGTLIALTAEVQAAALRSAQRVQRVQGRRGRGAALRRGRARGRRRALRGGRAAGLGRRRGGRGGRVGRGAPAPSRPKTPAPPAASGSSTPPVRARRWRPWASPRRRARAGC
ncbi:MAG: hypothetical protein WKF40_11805 [Thermoleophilaceae bacterium]